MQFKYSRNWKAVRLGPVIGVFLYVANELHYFRNTTGFSLARSLVSFIDHMARDQSDSSVHHYLI